MRYFQLIGHANEKEIPFMPDVIADLLHELVLGTRILANENVLDAFGHVSVRHPRDPNRYFISRHRAPELAEVSDLVELDLDSEPVRPTDFRLYSERVIHGEIYKARPEVNAVCHHHAHSVLPFCISGQEIVPVFHLGAAIGERMPFWDQRDEFGDTNMLVIKPEEGASLARALGPHWMVLMRRHGATVAGTSLRELVFRTVFICHNAELQTRAMAHGHVGPLSAGEVERSAAHSLRPASLGRAWDYWVRHVERAGLMPPAAARGSTASARAAAKRAKARPAKRAAPKAKAGAKAKAKKRR
jgi:HCOMODA/2-hydroxy-3-carboxy-muconic semialdehyde decarboxylase